MDCPSNSPVPRLAGERMYFSKKISYPSNESVDMQTFLGNAISDCKAVGAKGYLTGLWAEIDYSATTGSGNTLRFGNLAGSCLDRVDIRDRYGERLVLQGNEWYDLHFVEFSGYDGINLGASSSAVTGTVVLHVPIECWDLDPTETWWDLDDFFAGTMNSTWISAGTIGAGTNTAALDSATTIQWFATVCQRAPIDGHPEGKRRFRTVWKSTAVNSSQFSTAIAPNSLLRSAFVTTGREADWGTTQTYFTAGSQTLQSRVGGYTNMPDTAPTYAYLRRRQPYGAIRSVVGSNNAATRNPFVQGVAQILYFPRRLGEATDYPVTSSVDFQTSLSFGTSPWGSAGLNPRLVWAIVEDDPARKSATCDDSPGAIMHTDKGGSIMTANLSPSVQAAYAAKIPGMAINAQQAALLSSAVK